MVSLKNKYIQLVVALFLVTVPVLGFAMEPAAENDQTKALVSFQERVATNFKDGASFVVQQAWDHPKTTLVLGTTACAIILVRRYLATGKDLDATKKRLNQHLDKECGRVVALKDEHDKDTQELYTKFKARQATLATVLTAAGTNIDDTRNSMFGLLEHADALGLQQTAAFSAIGRFLKQSAVMGNDSATQLNSMQQSATQTGNSHGSMQRHMVVLLRNLGSAKTDMAALLQQMRQSGQDTTLIEQEMAALLAQLKAQNPQFLAEQADDVRIELITEATDTKSE